MKRRKAAELDRLRRHITRLDGDSIDRLYGLEPVWEPGVGQPGVAPEEFIAVLCPYCGERLDKRIDLTVEETAYIEDCEVCCRPIEFQIQRDERGALLALQVQRLD
jgi:Cysteine-rich CPXCG